MIEETNNDPVIGITTLMATPVITDTNRDIMRTGKPALWAVS